MLRLYNALLLPLRPVVALWARRDSRRRTEWEERRARRLPHAPPGGAWIHGSSVGEARIVGGLARALRERLPGLALAVSAWTPAGRAQLPDPPAVDATFFAPLDLPGLPRRVLRALRPAALVLVETELWPNLLAEAHAEAVPVVVLNGRLSERRRTRYRRLDRLYRPLVGPIAAVGAQSAEDAARFVELGVPDARVVVTGNIKYDLGASATDPVALRQRLGLDVGHPVLIAGSTGPGEEALVLEAFVGVRRSRPGVRLILAPRHPARGDEVESLCRERGLGVARLSAAAPTFPTEPVLLVDTLGQLGALYAVGQAAFVGGSLVPVGGHNVLEPAAAGVPVLFGPHTDNVREPVAALLAGGGGLRVRDAGELAATFEALLAEPQRRAEVGARAAAVVRAHRGALAHSVALVLAEVTRTARAGGATP